MTVFWTVSQRTSKPLMFTGGPEFLPLSIERGFWTGIMDRDCGQGIWTGQIVSTKVNSTSLSPWIQTSVYSYSWDFGEWWGAIWSYQQKLDNETVGDISSEDSLEYCQFYVLYTNHHQGTNIVWLEPVLRVCWSKFLTKGVGLFMTNRVVLGTFEVPLFRIWIQESCTTKTCFPNKQRQRPAKWGLSENVKMVKL